MNSKSDFGALNEPGVCELETFQIFDLGAQLVGIAASNSKGFFS